MAPPTVSAVGTGFELARNASRVVPSPNRSIASVPPERTVRSKCTRGAESSFSSVRAHRPEPLRGVKSRAIAGAAIEPPSSTDSSGATPVSAGTVP